MPDQIKTLVFDWGNTLMKLFPQYSGVMAEWPQVAAVDGALEALSELQGRCRMVVATNAFDSDAAQIRAALERVGLARYIDKIYTYHELRSRKPSPGFFHAVEEAENTPARRMVMVGDEFMADISGPWQCAWKTVWLNPERKAAPALLPLQTAEIGHFAELPAALERLDLPGMDACAAWMVQSGAAANLLEHVRMVASLAYQMAVWLRAAGETVDPLLAHRGGFLHDIAKLVTVKNGNDEGDHGEVARRMLLERGQPELAEIAYRHMLDRLIGDESMAPVTWEQKLAYFADKLVERGRLAPIEERMAGLRQRYPHFIDGVNAAEPKILEMQADLCRHMGFPPEELIGRLLGALQGS